MENGHVRTLRIASGSYELALFYRDTPPRRWERNSGAAAFRRNQLAIILA